MEVVETTEDLTAVRAEGLTVTMVVVNRKVLYLDNREG